MVSGQSEDERDRKVMSREFSVPKNTGGHGGRVWSAPNYNGQARTQERWDSH